MNTDRSPSGTLFNWSRIISLLLPVLLFVSVWPHQPAAVARVNQTALASNLEAIPQAALAAQPTPNPATLPNAPVPIAPPDAYASAHNCAPSSAAWTRFAGQGVNVICGSFVAQSADLQVAGRGLPFAFVRSYSSANATAGALGFGWTHNYNQSLTVETATSVLIRAADGRLDRYTLSAGVYAPPPGVFSTLVNNGDGTFTLTERDQTRYRFDSTGRLSSIADRNSNTLSLNYTAGRLTIITDTVGRVFTFSYDANGRLTQLADPMPTPRTVTFAYNAAGDLTSTTDTRGKTTTFTYDSAHRLLTVTDARPQLVPVC